MERILNIYSLEDDPDYPLVCFDEKSYQVPGDTIAPIPRQPGKPKKVSDKYERNGTMQMLVACLPNIGKRFVWVSPTRKAAGFAFFMNYFMDNYLPEICPDFKGITMVCDNLNTHGPDSYYKAFDAQTALDMAQKVNFNFTPVNGSWLNMAEIEIHALSVQCLHRRMKDQKNVTQQLECLIRDRNEKGVTTNWQFSINNARERFGRFYSILNS